MENWENKIRRVTPYVPGEQPKRQDVIKLNTNENPYPPSPKVQAVLDSFSPELLRKYPDPTAGDLVAAISAAYQVPEDQIFVGVGSDDVLAMSFMTFFNSDLPILFPDITYSFYDVWAEEFRIPYKQLPLDEDFQIRPEDYAIPNGGIVIPNPNAPTGLEAYETMVRILEANRDSVVIIDEAYIDFGGRSLLPLIDQYDNLLVVQTCSKSRSLAGSRIGFAFGSKKLISYLSDVKYSFNSYTMDALTIRIGAAAFSDSEYFEETRAKIMETRNWTAEQLRRLGFTFPESKSNFIFAHHDGIDTKKLFCDLKEAGIFVRYFDKPRIDSYLRITIGTPEEMKQLIGFLEQYPGIA